MHQAGLIVSGLSPDGRLVEIIELRDHPWFVASQFHPELKSRPTRPHPLFRDFVKAVKTHADVRDGQADGQHAPGTAPLREQTEAYTAQHSQ
jgi:hypothetical protein